MKVKILEGIAYPGSQCYGISSEYPAAWGRDFIRALWVTQRGLEIEFINREKNVLAAPGFIGGKIKIKRWLMEHYAGVAELDGYDVLKFCQEKMTMCDWPRKEDFVWL